VDEASTTPRRRGAALRREADAFSMRGSRERPSRRSTVMRLCTTQPADIRVTRRRSDLTRRVPPTSTTIRGGVDNGRSISAAFSARPIVAVERSRFAAGEPGETAGSEMATRFISIRTRNARPAPATWRPLRCASSTTGRSVDRVPTSTSRSPRSPKKLSCTQPRSRRVKAVKGEAAKRAAWLPLDGLYTPR
jgi:hypothetical protein